MHQFHGCLVAQTELPVCMRILPLLFRDTAEGIVGISFIQPVIFIQHRNTLCFDRGDGAEQIPHDLEMVVHFAAPAHHIPHFGILPAITGTACDWIAFDKVNVFSWHLRIAYQEASCGQRGQTSTNKIGGFLFNSFRLQRTGKSFIVTAGIIHDSNLLLFFTRSV